MPSDLESVTTLQEQTLAVLSAMGVMLRAWPFARNLHGQLDRIPRAPRPSGQTRAHHLKWDGRRWR
eukprot:3289330-Pyramimonas_sp.AAC.1